MKHTLVSIKYSTYMLVPALCLILCDGEPSQRACIILIKLYMQATQPKASKQSPDFNRAPSHCFEK